MSLLKFTSKGIYCPIADVYLDPWKGVNKALITHGHSDHARWGSKHYITNEINVSFDIIGSKLINQCDTNGLFLLPNTRFLCCFLFLPLLLIPSGVQ